MWAVWSRLPEFGQALGVTIGLALLAWVGAFAFGTLLAVMRISPIRPARFAAFVYQSVARNIPIPVQMVLFVFGLPLLGIKYSLFWSAATVLVLYTAAFVGDALLAGLNTVANGQMEASRALGLTPVQAIRRVVLPQAVAAAVQPLGNVCITMIKNTSVAALVGVAELTFVADETAVKTAETVAVFLAAGLVYVVIGFVVARSFNYVDNRLRIVK